jgi:hypothetical protein
MIHLKYINRYKIIIIIIIINLLLLSFNNVPIDLIFTFCLFVIMKL